jgi:Lon protease-like protein
MEKELALFPLNLVVFPDEGLNLHIFEPRYKQLINDCLELKSSFGIPSYIDDEIEFGTEVIITEVSKLYSDGRMDIKTRGVSVFKIVDFENPWKDRLYAGGTVMMMPEVLEDTADLDLKLYELARELFNWMHMEDEIKVGPDTPLHQYIHKLGLKVGEEYQLLKMGDDRQRKQYIIDHLIGILPALERAEAAKERVKMNGHFKNLDPLKF